jgi:hypothetical protein
MGIAEYIHLTSQANGTWIAKRISVARRMGAAKRYPSIAKLVDGFRKALTHPTHSADSPERRDGLDPFPERVARAE